MHSSSPVFHGPVTLELGARSFDLSSRALVMGIVNRTPDSFYDHGEHFALDASLRRAEFLIESGADIIDVGGVRAGPGPVVSIEEEIDRVLPAIEAIHARFEVPISVDTWQSRVAEAAFAAGCVLGNDISGFADAAYLEVAARYGASVVATHIRLMPRVNDPDPTYPDDDVVTAVSDYLTERLARALAAGLSRQQVIFDAGLDLGKTTPQSLELLRASDRLAELGQPLLLSASNKGFLGELLSLEIDQRREATFGTLALGVAKGCRILRVHDVKGACRIANCLSALVAT